MTHRSLLSALLLVTLAGCGLGSEDAPDRGVQADSTQTASRSDSTASGSSADSTSSKSGGGFFDQVTSFLFSNPRKEREQAGVAGCETDKDYSGRAMPFHAVRIDNGNDFNTTNEAFETSTPQAQTPYVAYATWDPCALYLGLTGSAVGAGDCAGGDCAVYDESESAYRYWLVYLDTDPQGSAGSVQPKKNMGPAPDRLPIRADYLLEIRLDGVTMQTGDGFSYQGNAQLYGRTSDWRVGLEEQWQPQGRDALTIGDNSSSNFLEVAISRKALGDPCAVAALGWVVDTRQNEAFAYWPPPRGFDVPEAATNARPTSGAEAQASRSQSQRDTSSARSGSSQADSTRRARQDSTQRAQRDSARRARQGQTASGSTQRDTSRSAQSDTLRLDHFGFMLIADQKPNASGNLNRSDYSLVAEGCTEPSRPRE